MFFFFHTLLFIVQNTIYRLKVLAVLFLCLYTKWNTYFIVKRRLSMNINVDMFESRDFYHTCHMMYSMKYWIYDQNIMRHPQPRLIFCCKILTLYRIWKRGKNIMAAKCWHIHPFLKVINCKSLNILNHKWFSSATWEWSCKIMAAKSQQH